MTSRFCESIGSEAFIVTEPACVPSAMLQKAYLPIANRLKERRAKAMFSFIFILFLLFRGCENVLFPYSGKAFQIWLSEFRRAF